MIDILQLQEIVRKASKLCLDRTAAKQTKEKGDYDFVTAVDEAVQKFIQEKLYALYPHIQFMGEEQDNSAIDMNGLVWVLDPVDGTTNLIHDYKNSAISLALLEKKEPIIGIVYNPFSDEMFYAEKGRGSFLNGEKVCVSDAKTMADSMISFGTSPYRKELAEENFKVLKEVFMDCQDIRRCGAASLDLAYVACGRIDGFFERDLKIWDYAAGVLIVREAGGEVLNFQGERFTIEPRGDVIAGNQQIAKVLAEEYFG